MPALAAIQAPAAIAPDWVRVAEHTSFSPRDTAEGVVFLDRMWLSNGYCPELVRDLWSSKDGVIWTKVLDATPYDGYAEMAVYQGKIWAIKESVWNSADGVQWSRVAEKTPFGVRAYGESIVHDNKLWQLGSGADVWWTTDGVNWTCAAKKAPYGGRFGAGVIAFQNRLWLLGGAIERQNDPPEKHYPKYTTCNDLWCSEDGTYWTRVLEHAPWEERMWSVPIVSASRLWLVGGFSNRKDVNLDDVWCTADGTTWEPFQTKTRFSARHEVTLYDFRSQLWLVAGNAWPLVNDVWKLEPSPAPGRLSMNLR